MHFIKSFDPELPCGPQITCHLQRLARKVVYLMSAAYEHDNQEAIHDARRCLKVMVALIGLLRGATDRLHLRSLRMKCRKALHCLGKLRDHQVIQQLLSKEFGVFSEIQTLSHWLHVRKTVRHLAENVRVTARDLRTRHARRGARDVLIRSWNKTAQLAEHARASPDVNSLHTLRRHAIRLRIQGIAISEMGGLAMEQIDSLESLCSDLGAHHDLAMAMDHADDEVISVMGARSTILQRRALERVRHLFSELLHA